ncbi:23S rRNA (uracil(1939)-C(5))-methyltransferase RlmD [Foetidibacter luteolus]|uniref:23S rRNA (uracil(1939)-C(5))-methyltransferase RlmD n=1 Tax=Foetidibacter luteolus TaxID=2608880 RepID=UPI001F1A19E0|nr:23S rRNA (uracil(1939)-C(5))-methyltransferase RlmD [Foetidibacter luteolus]
MRKKKIPVILEDVLVQDYAAEGKSLARVEGKVVFIENTVPGDVVDIRLYKSKKDWAEGTTIRFKQYSQQREKPFCSHFGVCGGCQWQMLPYGQQLKYKQKQVLDNLTRIGKLQLPEMLPIAGCAEDKYYRNKIEYTFCTKRFIPEEEFLQMRARQAEGEEIEDGGAYAGFHAKGMFDKVVEIDKCYLQKEPTNQLRNAIAAFAKKNGYSFYNIREHHGFLRTMMIRMASTGEQMLNIVFGYEDKAKREALLDYVLKQFPSLTTLLYTINTKRNDSIFDLDPQVYFGKGYIIEKLEDFQFKISPKSFFQTNTRQAERLYAITRDFAELTGQQVVYDLYCGTGSIGIFVSRMAKKIVGVEVVPEAIADAKENAALNNIQHASFFTGDVTDICNDDFFAANGRPDVIITDPPRAGMHEKLVKKLLEIAAPTVVYVSCNPATQARDLQLLSEKYNVTKIQPVDMFPHTHHIENVVQLKLKAG